MYRLLTARTDLSIDSRVKIYQEMHKNYNIFIKSRLSELPDEFLLSQTTLLNIEILWNKLKKIENKESLTESDYYSIFDEYYRTFRLNHRISPNFLIRLINKTDGLIKNLSSSNREIEIQDFVDILHHLIIITNEEICGQTLLAGELMALLTWNLHLSKDESYIEYMHPIFSYLY